MTDNGAEKMTGGEGNTATEVHPHAWTDAFANKSAEAFGEMFADDVVLEASALNRPIKGRDQVMRVMGAASKAYQSLVFTQEATNGPRHYLEWEATAFEGIALEGITILVTDSSGQIVRAAIHHRPLDGLLRFSAQLRERLSGVIDSAYFYDPDETRTERRD